MYLHTVSIAPPHSQHSPTYRLIRTPAGVITYSSQDYPQRLLLTPTSTQIRLLISGVDQVTASPLNTNVPYVFFVWLKLTANFVAAWYSSPHSHTGDLLPNQLHQLSRHDLELAGGGVGVQECGSWEYWGFVWSICGSLELQRHGSSSSLVGVLFLGRRRSRRVWLWCSRGCGATTAAIAVADSKATRLGSGRMLSSWAGGGQGGCGCGVTRGCGATTAAIAVADSKATRLGSGRMLKFNIVRIQMQL